MICSSGRITLLLGILLGSIQHVFAAAPTSFCKCTCFTNSTIIPLDAPSTNTFQHLLQRDSNHRRDVEDSQEPVPDPPLPPTTSSDRDKTMKDENGDEKKEYRAGNCNDCNRQFCLDYNLPICKKASMEDVFTTCFQRDSRKDEAVVFIFIFATVGLLGWAAVKPWTNEWMERARERQSYVPVDTGGG